MIRSPSDEALVAGLAAGDARAATAFVRRFQARVFGLAVTMVGDRAVAEELAQEAFARAWRHAGAYDARRGRVSTWLLTITRNLAIDHLRAKRTEPLDPDAIGEAETALWATAAAPIADEPERETAELRESLAELPADQRRALLLAALFGYTAREIGEIERIPLGTAKTRIRTAMLEAAAEAEKDGRCTRSDGPRLRAAARGGGRARARDRRRRGARLGARAPRRLRASAAPASSGWRRSPTSCC